MRGRFAPSPTGAMHLGNARTALLGWLAARRARGQMVLRIEDLDRARIAEGAEARLIDELGWLGLDWDEGPYRQSERATHYNAAIDRLLASGCAFPCACSRADVARAASAPHEADEDGPRYPGTCRALATGEAETRARAQGRQPVVRFRSGGARLSFVDGVHGPLDPFGPMGLDDFVLRRSDGTAAYQLAVVVDDAAMRITQVLRGDDLVRSTPRQIALYQALGHAPPSFAHVPLVLGPAGDRLAKRMRPASVGDLRGAGVAAEAIVGAHAASAGQCAPGTRARPVDLISSFDLARLPRRPTPVEEILP